MSASMTLLEMTQNILSAMDSDDVNSISDTSESWQVATVVQETFYDQFLNRLIPEEQTLIALSSGGNSAVPTWLIVPNNAPGMAEIEWIKYDTQNLNQSSNPPTTSPTLGCYQDVKYLSPEEFMFHTNVLAVGNQPNTASVSITIPNGGAFTYAIFTNTAPSFWTSFDDVNLYFDSYNSAIESTLEASNCVAWGQLDPDFPMADGSVPPIDSNLFPLLLAEAKSVCFNNFKQMPNAKEEQKSKRQAQRSQRFLWKLHQRERQNDGYGYDMPNYSRVPK